MHMNWKPNTLPSKEPVNVVERWKHISPQTLTVRRKMNSPPHCQYSLTFYYLYTYTSENQYHVRYCKIGEHIPILRSCTRNPFLCIWYFNVNVIMSYFIFKIRQRKIYDRGDYDVVLCMKSSAQAESIQSYHYQEHKTMCKNWIAPIVQCK
jgi:hypothetical protein